MFEKMLKGILWGVFIALGGAGGWLSFNNVSDSTNSVVDNNANAQAPLTSNTAGVDAELTKIASDLNKMLPMSVDGETKWESVGVEPGKTLIYRYRVVNYTKDHLFNEKAFTNLVRSRILSQYQNNVMMKDFREKGISLKYFYTDKNGEFLATILVGPYAN